MKKIKMTHHGKNDSTCMTRVNYQKNGQWGCGVRSAAITLTLGRQINKIKAGKTSPDKQNLALPEGSQGGCPNIINSTHTSSQNIKIATTKITK